MEVPPIKPAEPWRPDHFIGQFGTLPIDVLPDLGERGFAQVIHIGKPDASMSAKQMAELAHAFRQVAVITTTILHNLMLK